MKFESQFIQVGASPTIIVGQNPGKQRKSALLPGFAWDGNPSADLLWEAISGTPNLVLTNVWQYQWAETEGELQLAEGVSELHDLIQALKPRRVIALGQLAYETCIALYFTHTPPVARLEHPSYVVRFKRDRLDWIYRLQLEIDSDSREGIVF